MNLSSNQTSWSKLLRRHCLSVVIVPPLVLNVISTPSGHLMILSTILSLQNECIVDSLSSRTHFLRFRGCVPAFCVSECWNIPNWELSVDIPDPSSVRDSCMNCFSFDVVFRLFRDSCTNCFSFDVVCCLCPPCFFMQDGHAHFDHPLVPQTIHFLAGSKGYPRLVFCEDC